MTLIGETIHRRGRRGRKGKLGGKKCWYRDKREIDVLEISCRI